MTATQTAAVAASPAVELPEGWIEVSLREVVGRIVDGSHNPPKGQSTGQPMLSARNVENGRIVFDNYRLISQKDFDRENARTKIEPGHVLLTIVGSIGRSSIVPPGQPFSLQRSVAVLKPIGINNHFLMYQFQSPRYQSYFSEEGVGTAQKGIYLGKLGTSAVLLPPYVEQKRIVDKLEQLLSRVNVAGKRLAGVPNIIKRFRQAVFAAACSGRLTADWRRNHFVDEPGKHLLNDILIKRQERFREQDTANYAEPRHPDESGCPDVPEGWAIATFDQMTCLITSGSRGWAKYYSESGPLFIRAQDINTDQLRLDEAAHVRPPQNAEGQRTRVQLGDLLVTITGANVTKSAVVDQEVGESYVSQHVALLRPVESSLSHFLYLWIVSPLHGRAKLLRDAYGAGKPGLNLDNIKEIVVGLPPLEEQKEIIQRVDSLFRLVDAIEKRVAAATARAEKLTQAILAKAFRGELVPTEAELAREEGRSYETASDLLARIQSEGPATTKQVQRKPRSAAYG